MRVSASTQNTLPVFPKLASANLDPLSVLGFREQGYTSFEQIVSESITGGYKEGYNGKVYLIPRMNNYVLKVLKAETLDTNLELVKDPLPERNISQIVARKGRYQILKRQYGITGGVPFQHFKRVFTPSLELKEIDNEYRDYIKMVHNMPQKAYEHLAETMVALNGINYHFDWSHGRNLIFNLEDSEINVVDLERGHIPLTVGHMVPPLLDTIYAYYRKNYLTDMSIPLNEIIQKAIEAALKVGLPIPNLLGEATVFEEHARMEFAFELAGNKGKWPSVRKKILSASKQA